MISDWIQEPASDVRVAAKANVVVVGGDRLACRPRSPLRATARR